MYHLNHKSSFDIHEEKQLRVYKKVGEITTDSIRDMHLKIATKEFILFYGVSDVEILKIKNKLELFFAEELVIEYKTK